MIATESGKIQGLDFTQLFFGALLKPIRSQLDTWEWLKWQYWNYVFIAIAGLIVLYIMFWFWSNWLR